MVGKRYSSKLKILCKAEENAMQLYKALNRQYNKEDAVKVVINFIRKKLDCYATYFDVIEDSNLFMIKDSSTLLKNSDILNNDMYDENFCVVDTKPSMEKYKQVLYFKDKYKIEELFPIFYKMVNPEVLFSVPVFAQSKLVGLLIIYDAKKEGKLAIQVRKIAQLAAKELTAVFSRIDRQNLTFENMLGLTALENILLYNPEDDLNSSNDPLGKIVSIIPNATGMKKCTIALLDETEQFLLPHHSNFDKVANKRKYPLDRGKTKDHTAIIAIETKKPVIVYDALTDPRCDPDIAKKLGVFSNITLPLLSIHGKPIGVMYLDNGRYETFSKRQIKFYEIIARHIALVISNMEYIGDLKIWSKYDGLTGLLNRRTFDNVYDEIYNTYRFSQEKFSILMIDIDDFKSTNDNYGHQMGDKVLRNVAKCIKENVRDRDIVARYGGEEIILILKDVCKEEARRTAERIRQSIENLSVDNIKVTVSIGISTFGVDSYNMENLIYIADKCLYEAKTTGKNKVINR